MNKTEKRIRDAAIALIARVGYERMSLRLLASDSGINSSTLYLYFKGKQELLMTLVMHYHDQRAQAWAQQCPADKDALVRLQAFVAFHIRHQLGNRDEAVLGAMELRSLDPEERQQISLARRRYLETLQGVLDEGVAQGLMRCEERKLTARIIVGLLTQACAWYREDGQMGVEELTVCYTRLVLNMLEVGSARQQVRSCA